MNKHKLKELWDAVKIQHWRFSQDIHDLITAYRQLEKDKEKLEVLQDIDADTINNYAEAVAKLKEANAELLAALKPFAKMGEALEKSKTFAWKCPETEVMYVSGAKLTLFDFRAPLDLVNKHKGE